MHQPNDWQNFKQMINTIFWIILLEIIIALFGAYLIYYSRKKGQNQADKEDLEELTTLVESVKQKYAEDAEYLRANLNIFTSKKNLIFNEEKQAIIDYFGQLNKWIWDSLNVQFIDFNHSNFQALTQNLINMRHDYNKTNIAFAKVQLLIKDNELVQLGHKTNMKTLEVHHFMEGLVKRLQSALSWEKMLVDQFTSSDFDFNQLSSDMKTFYQNQAKESKAERQEVIDEYFAKSTEIFNPAIKLRNEFMIKAQEYLNK